MAGIQWVNLVKMFQRLTVGRLVLVGWEVILWGIVAAGSRWIPGPWWMAIPASMGLALLIHELFFMMWAERVARVPEAVVYRIPGYVATLERWTGPVA